MPIYIFILSPQDIRLRLQTLPPPSKGASWPVKLAAAQATNGNSDDAPALMLPQLSRVRNLINQSLDVVDISTWTGDAQNAEFIAGQLRLLHDLLQEARQILKGGDDVAGSWWETSMNEQVRVLLLSAVGQNSSISTQDFDPPLPANLALNMSIYEGSVLLVFRTLHQVSPATPTTFSTEALSGLSLRQRLGLAARLPEHDESDQTFSYRGQDVRVREKVRVESQDPSLIAIMAKLSALNHTVGIARRNLAIVMGVDDDD